MNWVDTSLGLLGGLALFLYAIAKLAEPLRDVASPRMKHLLGRLTTSPLTGLITGCLTTIVLDSSSVTIILVIAVVHATSTQLRAIVGSDPPDRISVLRFPAFSSRPRLTASHQSSFSSGCCSLSPAGTMLHGKTATQCFCGPDVIRTALHGRSHEAAR
jgi:hypothetical protein